MKTSGVWLSLVERCVRDAEVVSSNLATPTIKVFKNKDLKYIADGRVLHYHV